ncbi:hypothetical protein BH10BAC1_BH10BAC1_05000 [soil metagenome]
MRNIVFIFFFLTSASFAQNEYKLIKTIETTADYFTTDNQNNIYIVKADELSKYDKTGKLLYKYSNKNLGTITFVDASNMLRVLLFYKDFSQIVYLDNTLSQNGEPINISLLNIYQAPLACSSYDNGIWVYDQQTFSIFRYDKTLQNIRQTNLNGLANDSIIQPSGILEYDNKLYLNNPRSGIMIFDIYGTYSKTIPVKNAIRFQPIGDWVYYLFDKKVKAYNIKTTEEKEFEMPLSDFLNFRLEMGVLMLQTEKSISLFSAE